MSTTNHTSTSKWLPLFNQKKKDSTCFFLNDKQNITKDANNSNNNEVSQLPLTPFDRRMFRTSNSEWSEIQLVKGAIISRGN